MNKFFLLPALLVSLAARTQTITGFSGNDVALQLQTEQKFDDQLNAAHIGSTIKQLSSKPHNLGSPGSKEVADTILNRYKSYGFDAHIETFTVLFPTPKTRLLQMTEPTVYKALLKEPALKEDATSGQPDQLPTYNAWSADGDVTGELVFVNYGLPGDYDKLAEIGVDVKGKIVIAKYGHSWRGIKPKVAQEHGAIGCIIYSDPMDDGYYQGDVYPKGAFKNEFGVQRGSVMDIPVYPGDPLTPGVGATENAQRLASHNEAPNLLKIPVLPISYHDAKPLLEALDGPVVPGGWQGALPITYHIGAGKTKVHLKLEFNWNMVPCYDVVATLKGSEYPDEWVMRGNHHDAWVNGANDPISGQAAMLEEAKAIGELLKTGWRPKRTIVYCSWDGEEQALLGSTEFAEEHAKELQQKAVIYVNTDANGRGFLGAGGSHALQPLVDEISKTVTDPQTNVSVYERWKADKATNAATAKAKKDALQANTLDLRALGSGSDYSSFLQHLGVPSLDLGFGGEDDGGEYHSIYDSYDDYRRFKDPDFAYGVALSKTAGRAILRMADADMLPFDYSVLYKTVNDYTTELISVTNDMRDATAVENQLLRQNDYKLAADPTKTFIAPTPKDEVPYLDFSPLQNALNSFKVVTDTLSSVLKKMATQSKANENINVQLFRAEQQLLLPNGLPRRGWYMHSLYAPGFYTGYGVKTLPGIREAIEQRKWKEAQEQINAATQAVQKLSDYLANIQRGIL
ncbi:MAG TPA: transferrin receptor-like dimerization domain-containing protein [Parafilimonas sp.]|nr:transferrin receptor-like dimerization domain-containing protein [Parafilimonas sp.]